MNHVIRHRGPDSDGFYLRGPVGLGIRRLSVIDLTTGRQPLSNEDGTVWLVFNGEIYNYRDLREARKTKGNRVRTVTDTETIVHLDDERVTACIDLLRGMFA